MYYRLANKKLTKKQTKHIKNQFETVRQFYGYIATDTDWNCLSKENRLNSNGHELRKIIFFFVHKIHGHNDPVKAPHESNCHPIIGHMYMDCGHDCWHTLFHLFQDLQRYIPWRWTNHLLSGMAWWNDKRIHDRIHVRNLITV